jgi:tRNA(Leu) C34 or U34 (ribose-2'-O)-methylase TrmL
LRAAGCFGVAAVFIYGKRYQKAPTDTMKTYRHIPLIHTDDLRASIPYDCIPVAIEITNDARLLPEFTHPQRAFYVFGPEDGSISKEILGWCKHKVQIPSKQCLNLAACVNVLLYDRISKLEGRHG